MQTPMCRRRPKKKTWPWLLSGLKRLSPSNASSIVAFSDRRKKVGRQTRVDTNHGNTRRKHDPATPPPWLLCECGWCWHCRSCLALQDKLTPRRCHMFARNIVERMYWRSSKHPTTRPSPRTHGGPQQRTATCVRDIAAPHDKRAYLGPRFIHATLILFSLERINAFLAERSARCWARVKGGCAQSRAGPLSPSRDVASAWAAHHAYLGKVRDLNPHCL